MPPSHTIDNSRPGQPTELALVPAGLLPREPKRRRSRDQTSSADSSSSRRRERRSRHLESEPSQQHSSQDSSSRSREHKRRRRRDNAPPSIDGQHRQDMVRRLHRDASRASDTSTLVYADHASRSKRLHASTLSRADSWTSSSWSSSSRFSSRSTFSRSSTASSQKRSRETDRVVANTTTRQSRSLSIASTARLLLKKEKSSLDKRIHHLQSRTVDHLSRFMRIMEAPWGAYGFASALQYGLQLFLDHNPGLKVPEDGSLSGRWLELSNLRSLASDFRNLERMADFPQAIRGARDLFKGKLPKDRFLRVKSIVMLITGGSYAILAGGYFMGRRNILRFAQDPIKHKAFMRGMQRYSCWFWVVSLIFEIASQIYEHQPDKKEYQRRLKERKIRRLEARKEIEGGSRSSKHEGGLDPRSKAAGLDVDLLDDKWIIEYKKRRSKRYHRGISKSFWFPIGVMCSMRKIPIPEHYLSYFSVGSTFTKLHGLWRVAKDKPVKK